MSELPSGWAAAPVLSCLKTTIGGVWGRDIGNGDVDASVVRVADFRDDGTIHFSSVPRRSISARQLESRELQQGDILLEKSGGGSTKPVGRVVRFMGGKGRVIPTNFVQLLRPEQQIVDTGFLFWWLWKSHVDGSAAAFQRATTNIRNLRTQDYLGRIIPVPPLPEQWRIRGAIEGHLSRLDAADCALRDVRVRLGLLAKAVIANSIPDDEPQRTLQSLASSDDRAITDGPFGSNLKTEHYTPSGPRVIRLQNIGDGSFVEADAHISREQFDRLRRHEVLAGDLVVAALGTELPRACVIPPHVPPAIVKADCIRVRLGPDVIPEYANLALNSPGLRRRTSRIIHGVGRPRLNLGEVRQLAIPVPSLDDQRRIVAEVEHQLSLIDALFAEVDAALGRSKALRRSILEQAFVGKLVPQDPADEPAPVLLERIAAERAAAAPVKRTGRGRPRGAATPGSPR